MRKSSVELLRPDTPADRQVLYMLVKDALDEKFPMNPDPVRDYHFHFRVAEQAIRYVADALIHGPYTGGPAVAFRWIAAAADAALVRMLEGRAPSGTVWTVARDDISLPDAPRGLWSE